MEELIRRHTEATYTVAFTGFAPGFAYMTCDDPAFDVPASQDPACASRRPVALGGSLAAFILRQPLAGQRLGRTPLKMWDTAPPPAALLAPATGYPSAT